MAFINFKPASEPTSFISWLGFSYDDIGTPLISEQSLLRYCWVSSRAHSSRYSDWSCLSIVPASSPSFSSSEFVIVVEFFIEVSCLAFNTLESSYGSVIFLGKKSLHFSIALHLSINTLMLDLSSSISLLISRLILGRNSSFQILLNSFALKFPSFITLGSLGSGAAGQQLPRLFCPLWLYQGDRKLCTIEIVSITMTTTTNNNNNNNKFISN